MRSFADIRRVTEGVEKLVPRPCWHDRLCQSASDEVVSMLSVELVVSDHTHTISQTARSGDMIKALSERLRVPDRFGGRAGDRCCWDCRRTFDALARERNSRPNSIPTFDPSVSRRVRIGLTPKSAYADEQRDRDLTIPSGTE